MMIGYAQGATSEFMVQGGGLGSGDDWTGKMVERRQLDWKKG